MKFFELCTFFSISVYSLFTDLTMVITFSPRLVKRYRREKSDNEAVDNEDGNTSVTSRTTRRSGESSDDDFEQDAPVFSRTL